MPLPLLLIGGAALAGMLATGFGAAVNNWTSPPETYIDEPTAPVYTYPLDNAYGSTSGIGISTNTMLIAGAVLLAIMYMRK